MMPRLQLAISALTAAVLFSAFMVIDAKHQNRQAFVDLQNLQQRQYQLQTEWGQLQLEQATWATHGRIEQIARKELGMTIPPVDSIYLVKP